MVSRQTDKESTEVRVYKYGLVPLGQFPEEAIEELWRANKLWNSLVALHNKSREDYEEARCAAHPVYGEISERLNEINEQIDQAFESKRNARMEAGTKDASHPLIKDANAVITALKKKRQDILQSSNPLGLKLTRRLIRKLYQINSTKLLMQPREPKTPAASTMCPHMKCKRISRRLVRELSRLQVG